MKLYFIRDLLSDNEANTEEQMENKKPNTYLRLEFGI